MSSRRIRNVSPGRRPRRIASYALALLVTALGTAGLSGGAVAAPNEYEVKAAFLYNFAKFTAWPSPPGPAEDTFTICILGDDPFGPALDLLKGKPVDGRPVEVRRLTKPGEIGRCRIVFVGPPHAREIGSLAEKLRDQPVLTVGDGSGFVRSGGMIGFVLSDGRVRFEIGPDRISPTGLTVSSQLLKLAIIVRAGDAS
jgi:hypothetical protein